MNEDIKNTHKLLDSLFENLNNTTSKFIENPDFDWMHDMENEIKKSFKELNSNLIYKKLPKRKDTKYTRIENYEDYEFTHCIAYEMAIRNEEVIKLTDIIEKLNLLNYNILCNFNSSQSNEEKEKYFDKLINSPKELTINIENSFNTILEIKDKINNQILENLDEKNILILINTFMEILDNYENDYLLDILNTYNAPNIEPLITKYNENDLKNLFKKSSMQDKYDLIILLLVSIQTKLEKEYYVVNEQKSTTPEYIEEYISKDTNYEPNIAINEHINISLNNPNYIDNYDCTKGYTLYQGLYEDDNSFYINKVTPNFSQPLRMFNTMEISINPSLPLNDILSFVKKIKEDYDKKESFKSFFELVEKDLEFSVDKKTTVDKSMSYSKEKWADMFYIYDYFQFYFSENDKINKGDKQKEDDETTIAKELSLQLSYYHILKDQTPLDFSKSADIGNYNSAYDYYETDFIEKIKENMEGSSNKEKIKFYVTDNHIKEDYYPKMKDLIEGNNPKYKKFIDGRNHAKNSLIEQKNNISSRL
jgi:hypothetical protein